LIIAAFQTFIFALMIRALGAMLPDPNRPHPNRDNAA
jgi:hypothetical protein